MPVCCAAALCFRLRRSAATRITLCFKTKKEKPINLLDLLFEGCWIVIFVKQLTEREPTLAFRRTHHGNAHPACHTRSSSNPAQHRPSARDRVQLFAAAQRC